MILVIDIGTTSVRVATMSSDGDIVGFQQQQQPPSSPFAGLVEFDPIALANTVQELATSAVNAVGAVTGVAITQRASTVVWDRSSGEPVGPGLSWQDLRTVGECMTARSEHGVTVAPNQARRKHNGYCSQSNLLSPTTSALAQSIRGSRGCCLVASLT